jgi:hypothetical protein
MIVFIQRTLLMVTLSLVAMISYCMWAYSLSHVLGVAHLLGMVRPSSRVHPFLVGKMLCHFISCVTRKWSNTFSKALNRLVNN